MRKKTSISIDEVMEERLRGVAKDQRRSLSQVIGLALEFGLPEVEERCALRFSKSAQEEFNPTDDTPEFPGLVSTNNGRDRR